MIELLCAHGNCTKLRGSGLLCSMHAWRKRNGKDMDAPDQRARPKLARLIEAATHYDRTRAQVPRRSNRYTAAYQQFNRALVAFRFPRGRPPQHWQEEGDET